MSTTPTDSITSTTLGPTDTVEPTGATDSIREIKSNDICVFWQLNDTKLTRFIVTSKAGKRQLTILQRTESMTKELAGALVHFWSATSYEPPEGTTIWVMPSSDVEDIAYKCSGRIQEIDENTYAMTNEGKDYPGSEAHFEELVKRYKDQKEKADPWKLFRVDNSRFTLERSQALQRRVAQEIKIATISNSVFSQLRLPSSPPS